MSDPDTSDTGFDLDASMSAIGSAMADLPETEDQPADEVVTKDDATDVVALAAAADPDAAPLEMPKSWSRDKATLWTGLPREAQEYYGVREKQFLDGLEMYKGEATTARQYKELLAPYAPMLQSMGLKDVDAVRTLLNAQYQLTHGSEAERRIAYDKIGKSLGYSAAETEKLVGSPDKALQDRLDRIESALTADRQRALEQAKSEAASQVEKFASDPKHEYFGEVAQDMLPLINAGHTIESAYERAVWANPVTRAKEQSKLQTAAADELKAKAKLEAEAARKGTSANIRSTESRKAPTEPKGKMFDDMPDLLAEIRARAT